MNRLTTDKPKTMVEKSLNQRYIESGEAMLRGFEEKTSCRDFARRLLRIHTKADYVNANDDFFDECILDALQYGHTDIEGVIAMYYDALVSNAELREQLKKYEDAEEQGRLVKLPCKVGDTVYAIASSAGKRLDECEAYTVMDITVYKNNIVISISDDGCFIRHIYPHDVGKTVFLTREEAERAIKEGETE